MYRLELDRERKIAVLILHGTQDGWEAKLMKMEIESNVVKLGGWRFILDMSDLQSVLPVAHAEYARTNRILKDTQFASVATIPSKRGDVVPSLVEDINAWTFSRFEDAWVASGGEDRGVLLMHPKDGSRMPANNPPPNQGH